LHSCLEFTDYPKRKRQHREEVGGAVCRDLDLELCNGKPKERLDNTTTVHFGVQFPRPYSLLRVTSLTLPIALRRPFTGF